MEESGRRGGIPLSTGLSGFGGGQHPFFQFPQNSRSRIAFHILLGSASKHSFDLTPYTRSISTDHVFDPRLENFARVSERVRIEHMFEWGRSAPGDFLQRVAANAVAQPPGDERAAAWRQRCGHGVGGVGGIMRGDLTVPAGLTPYVSFYKHTSAGMAWYRKVGCGVAIWW